MNQEEDTCEDCMAHYPKGYKHVCSPWLKALVKLKKIKDARR